MVFLKFYVLSTVIVLITWLITVKTVAVKLKREGFITNKKTSRIEILHSILPLLVPIINIGLAIVFIFKIDDIERRFRNKIQKVYCEESEE